MDILSTLFSSLYLHYIRRECLEMKLNEKQQKMETVHIGYLGFNMDHSRIQYGPKRKKKKTYMCLVTETVYLCNKKQNKIKTEISSIRSSTELLLLLRETKYIGLYK